MKNISRTESFPISESIVREFIEVNKQKWAEVPSNGKCIIINLSMVRMQAVWVIPKLLCAKGLQEQTGATPIALTWKANPLLTDFFKSFGVKHIIINELCKKKKIAGIRAVLKTLSIICFHHSGEAMKNMNICGLRVGKDFYEDILRTSSLSTLHSCRNKIAIKKILHISWAMYSLEAFHKQFPVAYAVMDDFAYHEAAFIKLYNGLGAKVISCSNRGYGDISFTDNGEIKKRMMKAQEFYKTLVNTVTSENITEAEQLISERFQGKNGREIDRGAFLNKKNPDKKKLIKLLGLDSDKKSIIIMAHTFTDAVFNYGDYYFRDYYDWLEKTLAIAEEVANVNWILKPHPTRSAYNESKDSIEDMYSRHKKDHIFIVSDDISATSIKDIADAVVTIGGNAGAEYACFGIPAVIVGKTWYVGFGYTIEPETYKEYEDCLRNIGEIKKLTSEQVIMAKKLFYLHNRRHYDGNIFDDELANFLNKKYDQMIEEIALQYFQTNDGTIPYNDKILEEYNDYIKSHDVRKSKYYNSSKIFI